MAKTIAAEDVQWSAILEEVEQHEEIVITKDGRPVARVVPIERDMRGPMYGTAHVVGDIVAPLDEEWDVDR